MMLLFNTQQNIIRQRYVMHNHYNIIFCLDFGQEMLHKTLLYLCTILYFQHFYTKVMLVSKVQRQKLNPCFFLPARLFLIEHENTLLLLSLKDCLW